MSVERFVRSARRAVGFGLVCVLTIGVGRAQQQPIQLAPDVREMRSVLGSGSRMFAATAPSDDELRNPASGTYDVVALRVEFQPDTSRFTTGTGRLEDDPYGGLEPAVDPLPHDASYFQAHLDFLTDYVERVSDGTLEVRTHLLPEIVQVSGTMGSYAPTGPDADSDAELAKLANLVEEAWMTADQQVGFDTGSFFPEKTAFILFHAGVGRDIELIGTTLEKTPQDLPSLFFDRNALDRLGVGEIEFNGFPVDHSVILPRTETRLGTDFIADEPFLLELSINGLLAASFFNVLGVPDLFDTETGESAIGPFGLMDAQGIFAYRGLFPPEPMAWTKYYLGWTDPMELGDEGRQAGSLRAASEFGSSESARASVSDAEYFLMENRFRDPEQDGLILRVMQNGSIVEQHVQNGDPEFNNATIEGFVGGVVVGVDNYDWALPGGVDENENPLNGGILIWHVDERRLRAGIPRNSVNVGAESRAIDLEEADGAQDIGFPSGAFGPQAELGTPFDFYYEGNPVTVVTAGGREIQLYENRFGPNTYPSSATNGGGPSFIVVDGFSAPSAEMSFAYDVVGVEGVAPIRLENEAAIEDSIQSRGLTFGVMSGITMSGEVPILYSASSETAFVLTTATSHSSIAMPVVDESGMVTLAVSEDGSMVLQRTSLQSGTSASEWIVELPADATGLGSISPLVRSASDGYYGVLSGPEETLLMEATASGAGLRSVDGLGPLVGIAAAPSDVGSGIFIAGRDGAGFLDSPRRWNYSIRPDAATGQPVIGRDAGGIVGALPVPSDGTMLLLLPDDDLLSIDVAAVADRTMGSTEHPRESLSPSPVLVDLDADSRLDVLVGYGSALFAFTQAGAVVSGFPIRLPAPVSAQPLVMRFEGEDRWTILSAAQDGYLYAHDIGGLRTGFPLEVGSTVDATPRIGADDRMYAVSGTGAVKAWDFPPVADIWWGERHRDGANSSLVALDSPPNGPSANERLIDPSETYNWPNPIVDGTTHLRIRTSRASHVAVTILDAGGGLVDELEFGQVPAGIPTEIEWEADVESGLYFARLTARSNQGDEETTVVKMAVVR